MNHATLLGRITRDLEPKTTSTTTILNFSLAVDRKYHKPGEEKEADFINCVAFKTTAENIAKYFHKGSRILVNGHIQTRKWEKDGTKQTSTEIVVDEFDFIDAKEWVKETSSTVKASKEMTQATLDDTKLPFDL